MHLTLSLCLTVTKYHVDFNSGVNDLFPITEVTCLLMVIFVEFHSE